MKGCKGKREKEDFWGLEKGFLIQFGVRGEGRK